MAGWRAGIAQSGNEPIQLRRVVTVASESEGGGARPEVAATADRVFVVYLGNVTRSLADGSNGPTFRVKIFDPGLSKAISSKILVSSTEAYGRPTDIRVASDGKHLYAFYETVLGNRGGFLWGAKYTLDDRFERIAQVGPIAQGKFWTQTQEGDELINDPIPLIGPDSVFVITRLKGKSPSKPERTVYRVREFTTDLKPASEFDLDLSAVADGEPRQSSALSWRGHFFMVIPTTSEEGNFPVDMAAPSDLLMVKLNPKWQVIESKRITDTPGDVATFVTGFQAREGCFFVTYKQGSPQRGFVSPLKIYDENFKLLHSETVRTATNRGESLKSSLAVTDRYLYVGYGIGEGPPPPTASGGSRPQSLDAKRQPQEAVVYVYERNEK